MMESNRGFLAQKAQQADIAANQFNTNRVEISGGRVPSVQSSLATLHISIASAYDMLVDLEARLGPVVSAPPPEVHPGEKTGGDRTTSSCALSEQINECRASVDNIRFRLQTLLRDLQV